MQRLGIILPGHDVKKIAKWNQVLKDFSQSGEMNDVIWYDFMCSFSKTNPDSII